MCDHCGCHDIAAIGELNDEHEQILGLAWTLVDPDSAADRVDDPDGQLLALLDLHVDKEETGLYPALVEIDGLSGVQRGRLEQDHVIIREALIEGRFGRTEFYALAAHVEEEEDELFPTAMFGFDDVLWARVEAAHVAASERAGAPADTSRP